MLAQDSEGTKVELRTNKVLPVDKDSKDTKELKGNLVGISNVAKFERARRELRPYVLLVVDFLENLESEDKRKRVREISRDVFGKKIDAVKELIKTYLGQTATSPLAMYLIFGEYFDIAESEALNIKQGEGTMVISKKTVRTPLASLEPI